MVKRPNIALWIVFFFAVVIATQGGHQHGQISGWVMSQFSAKTNGE